jgi:hypothetical protein
MAKLVESDNTDKRKLFEELFDAHWVDELSDKLAVRKEELIGMISTMESKISNDKTVLEMTSKKLFDDGEILRAFRERNSAEIE